MRVKIAGLRWCWEGGRGEGEDVPVPVGTGTPVAVNVAEPTDVGGGTFEEPGADELALVRDDEDEGREREIDERIAGWDGVVRGCDRDRGEYLRLVGGTNAHALV